MGYTAHCVLQKRCPSREYVFRCIKTQEIINMQDINNIFGKVEMRFGIRMYITYKYLKDKYVKPLRYQFESDTILPTNRFLNLSSTDVSIICRARLTPEDYKEAVQLSFLKSDTPDYISTFLYRQLLKRPLNKNGYSISKYQPTHLLIKKDPLNLKSEWLAKPKLYSADDVCKFAKHYKGWSSSEILYHLTGINKNVPNVPIKSTTERELRRHVSFDFKFRNNENISLCGSWFLSCFTGEDFDTDIDIHVSSDRDRFERDIIYLFRTYGLNSVYKIAQNRYKFGNYDIYNVCEKPWLHVMKFHMPCVRGYYSFKRKRSYLLPSMVVALLTGVNIDTRIFLNRDPSEIIQKYESRGFTQLYSSLEREVFNV